MSGGFYKRRRGILEHLEAGRITLVDLAIHDFLNLKANLLIGSPCSIPPGICITSAVAIHAVCGGMVSYKTIQRRLRHLEKIGWVKRFRSRGKKGNFPVLICRASVHDLSGREYRINADETTDWRDPKWTPVREESTNTPAAVHELSTHRELRAEIGEGRKKSPAAKPTPPADCRHKLVFDSCFELYRQKFRKPPTWAGREGKTLQRFLREHSNISAEEIVQRYRHVLASTACYHAEKHGALLHLLSNFDAFADGPLLGPSREGASNGKSVKPGFDPVATATALGFGRQILPD